MFIIQSYMFTVNFAIVNYVKRIKITLSFTFHIIKNFAICLFILLVVTWQSCVFNQNGGRIWCRHACFTQRKKTKIVINIKQWWIWWWNGILFCLFNFFLHEDKNIYNTSWLTPTYQVYQIYNSKYIIYRSNMSQVFDSICWL